MHGVLAQETLLDNLPLEVLDAARDVLRLVVEHDHHEVEGRMGVIFAEVPGFVLCAAAHNSSKNALRVPDTPTSL